MAAPTTMKDHSSNDPNYGETADERSRAPRFKLSPEEINVLKQCNQESFFYRCLPLGTIGMVAAHYAVQSGYLKGSAKYGSLWKVIGAGALGYFVGKFSYRSKCEEKIMKLPNSQLAEVIRKRSKCSSPYPETYNVDPSYSGTEVGGRGASATFHSTPDFDENVEYQGPDDSSRPNADDNPIDDRPSRGPSVSYDSLRHRNREEYEAKRSTPYRPERPLPPDDQRLASRQEPPKKAITNQYGDVIG